MTRFKKCDVKKCGEIAKIIVASRCAKCNNLVKKKICDYHKFIFGIEHTSKIDLFIADETIMSKDDPLWIQLFKCGK